MALRKPFTTVLNRLKKLAITDFLYHGIGSLGEVKDHGDITAGVNLHSALNGLFHRMRLISGTSFVFSNSLPEANGAGWIIVDNQTGAAVTPTWPGHFEFGAAGAPNIPDNTVCTILTAYDYEGGVFRCVHNTNAPGGSSVSDGSMVVNFGAEPGADGAIIAVQSKTLPIPANYSATGWQVIVEPAATVSIDVRVAAFPDTPDSGDSITDGNPITTTASVSNTGTTGSWSSTSLARGANLQIVITANDVARRISLTLLGDKS